jgi:hypothetical protein
MIKFKHRKVMKQKGFVNITIIIGVVILAVVLGYFIGTRQTFLKVEKLTGGTGRACTEEAKQCPDGSYVSRTGKNCEFAECPAINPPSIVPSPVTKCTKDSFFTI